MKNLKNHRILAKGEYRDNNTWVSGINNNDIIIGPSGAGKTRNYVKPNIMQCNESFIVADTKGNLHKQLGSLLDKNGYHIQVVNYKNVKNSMGYNPLDFIRYDKEKDTYSEQDIMSISAALVPVEDSKDPFWEHAARAYLTVLIGFTLECYEKKDHNLETIRTLFTHLIAGSFKDMIIEFGNNNPNSFAYRQYFLFCGNEKAEKMHTSIIGILGEKINTLTFSELIPFYTTSNRVSFDKISKEKTAIFLIMDDTDRSMDRLATLFYTQALQQLVGIADNTRKGRLEVPVRIILDDFATNAIIEDFDNLISVIRSREIYVSIILQSITQLYGIYGVNKGKTIINNCDNCLYLGGQDVDTADFIATKANRPLNEILEMPLNEAYLFTRGEAGKKVEKFDITKHENYKELPECQQLTYVSRFSKRARAMAKTEENEKDDNSVSLGKNSQAHTE